MSGAELLPRILAALVAPPPPPQKQPNPGWLSKLCIIGFSLKALHFDSRV